MKQTIIFTTVVSFLLVSCGTTKPVSTPTPPSVINLALIDNVKSNVFVGLDYGVRVNVKDDRSNTKVLQKYATI